MIQQLIGKLHPLLVHLPIGIILLAMVLKIYSRYRYQQEIKTLMPFLLKMSFAACLLSGITGFVLHLSGEYDDILVHNHLYAGVGLTLMTLVMIFTLNHKKINDVVWFVTCVLLFITGHLGGSLTHGENYLTLAADKTLKKPAIDMNHSVVFRDVIQPIFNEKCTSCHSDKKQKGGLRLDNYEYIVKGGEDGAIIQPGKSTESRLVKNILLPESHDDHMPPKGKPQLTGDEIKLISWWIDTGAGIDKTIGALAPDPTIKTMILQLNAGDSQTKEIVLSDIKPADQNIINNLRGYGMVIHPISQKDNYLKVNLSYSKNLSPSQIKALLPLKSHILHLKASGLNYNPELLEVIAQMENLMALYLDHTKVDDTQLHMLNSLKKLEYLNLASTLITIDGLKKLKMPSLKQLYLFGSKVDKTNFVSIANHFSGVVIDTGNYVLPILPGDTITVQ